MNYLLLALGIFTILTAVILIFLDKLKGEDIYLNIDVKEHEIKKVIEDADEIISELNYTSEMVVKEIEERLISLREELKNIDDAVASSKTTEKKKRTAPTMAASKKKKMTNDEDLNPKHKAVLDYASQGMSVTDIAKRMNIGQGEVMLILSLKNEVE